MEDTVKKQKKTEGLSIRAPEAVRAAIRHGAAIRNVSQSDFMIDACRQLLHSMNGEVLLPDQFEEIPVDRPGMMTIRLPAEMLEAIHSTAPRAYQKATQFVLWASMRAFYETPDKSRGAIDQAVSVSGKERSKFLADACSDLLDNIDEAVLEDFDDVLLGALEPDDDKLPEALSRRIEAAWDAAWIENEKEAKEAVAKARRGKNKAAIPGKVKMAKDRLASVREKSKAENRNTARERRYFIVQAAMRAYFEIREKYSRT